MVTPKTGVMAITGPLTKPTTKAPTTADGAVAKSFFTSIRTPCGAAGSFVVVAAMGRSESDINALTAMNNPSMRISPKLIPSGDSIRVTLVQIM
jgi:hypothetical protein